MSEANSDFSGMLQKVLANPEAMQKILELAGEMKGGAPGDKGGDPDSGQNGGTSGAPENGIRGEGMQKPEDNAPHPGTPQGEGPEKPPKREGGEAEENRIRLLIALKPYLNDDRREKADVMIRILKLLRFTDLNELTKLLGGISK